MADVIQVYGAPWCPDCRRAKRFLGEQRIPFEWHDVEAEPEGLTVVQERNGGANVIPTIVFPDGTHLSEPTNEELAEKLGLVRAATEHLYDLVVVGGGPAGLTASIYAARENLTTLVVDSKGLGGQAGVTERLENYPGFPEGVGGSELADRIVRQAERHGVEMLQAVSVRAITSDGERIDVETATGDHYHARAVLVATGSSYRRTDVPGEDELIGAGIHFCATCDGPFYKGSKELMVLGGGNSGLGEGLFLTQFTEKVTIVEDRTTGVGREMHPAGVFAFIGLDPNTAFLKGLVDLDQRGFLVTDDVFMTSMPGVFAAGDVRAGSTKQLASAVGEGAAAAIAIRRFLDRRESRL